MKFRKLSIIVCLLMTISLCSSASEFFKEGRCYWYRYHYGPTDFEIGMRVAEKEVIDGKEWNRIDMIKRMTRFYEDGEYEGYEVDNSIIPLAYVREENGDIYRTFEGIENKWSEKLPNDLMLVLYGRGNKTFDSLKNGLWYGYGPIGKNVKLGWWTEENRYETAIITKITNIEPYENSGHVYNKYTVEYTLEDGDWVEEFVIIESIGAFGPYDKGSDYTFPNERGDGQIIYDPLRAAMSGKDYNATLAYVTEGEDNEIIFEKVGGFKLWEFNEDGVEAISSDENVAARWFNLQGVEIPKPSDSGIYIRKIGNKVEKVRL